MVIKEKELLVLESIYASRKPIPQRDLARIVGLSLGMTNAILKRLAETGLLKIRKVNNRNIRYIVSAKGVEAITRRSYRYFKRTIKNVVFYREAIEALVHDIKRKQYTGLIYVGASDISFIVEWACNRHGIDWVRDEESYEGRIFTVYSETYIPDEDTKNGAKGDEADVAFLQDVLLWGEQRAYRSVAEQR